MSKFTVRRRYPNYFSGFEETEHPIDNLQDLESIDWVNNATTIKGHHCLAISTDDGKYKKEGEDKVHTLMALTHYDEEYGGYKKWWAIGYIIGGEAGELELPEWTDLAGDHKDGCPQKKNQHHKCECGFK